MRNGGSDLRPAAPRSRSKARKPKFLSLLPIELSTSASVMRGVRRHRRRQKGRQQPQLNLFPLRTETADGLVDDTKDDENMNVNLLFNGDDTSATTLSGLLDGGEDMNPAPALAVACSEEDSVGSRDSVRGLRDSTDYGREDDHCRSSMLVRAAMKSGGRDEVEKWVSYSEVVERKPLTDQEPEEVSSCSAAANSEDWGSWQPRGEAERSSGGLLLKLDYEEVLNSWSHKGSLFIDDHGGPLHHHHHEDAQTVPEIYSDLLGPDSAINNGPSDRWGNATVWTVPDHNSISKEKEGRFRQREASVLRYKEKRQNRLFAKRIRYEVRKLNAEKRPRIKGRFVRRGCEDD